MQRRKAAKVGTETLSLGGKKWMACATCGEDCLVDARTEKVKCAYCVATYAIKAVAHAE